MRKCTFLGINGWNYSCSQGQFHVSRHIVSIGPKVGEFPSGVLGGNQEEMEGGGDSCTFLCPGDISDVWEPPQTSPELESTHSDLSRIGAFQGRSWTRTRSKFVIKAAILGPNLAMLGTMLRSDPDTFWFMHSCSTTKYQWVSCSQTTLFLLPRCSCFQARTLLLLPQSSCIRARTSFLLPSKNLWSMYSYGLIILGFKCHLKNLWSSVTPKICLSILVW